MQKRRFLACALAAVMMMSMVPAALAAPIDDAASSVNLVNVTQALDRATGTDAQSDTIDHDFRTQGEINTVDYAAELKMTDVMAAYLTTKQKQLLNATFTVKINIETDKLDFVTNDDGSATFTFQSTFLKPVAGSGYTVSEPVVDMKDGYTWFTYSITVKGINDLNTDALQFNAELIVYYDGNSENPVVVGTSDIEKENGGYATYGEKQSLSSGMNADAWMQPITLRLGKMTLTENAVNGGKKASSGSPYTIKAKGTISGKFDYAIADPMTCIGDFTKAYHPSTDSGADIQGYKTMRYGENGSGWLSDEVVLNLYRSSGGGGGGYTPPPLLNTEDHFGYIIGYPVDYYTGKATTEQSRMPVRPQGQITRAEVATIFFRMLTDDARNQYWSQTSSYTDVSADDWFNNAICTLSNAGIISGYPNGSFQPNGKITRAEFATIASRFFDVEASGTDIFPDIDGYWAEDYINEAANAGIINGYEDGTFRPQQLITRAEAATMVNRTLGRAPVTEHFLPDMLVWPDNMDTGKWYYAQMQEATNSHEYEMKTASDGTKYEVWTKMLPIRDWKAFEKEWSDANAAENPGEVV